MTVYEWLAIFVAFLVQLGGLGRLILSIRDTAQTALTETEKNRLRIEAAERHMNRGTEKFDAFAKEMSEVKDRLTRIEEQLKGITRWLKEHQPELRRTTADDD